MAADARGWLGGLKSVLKQAEQSHQPHPQVTGREENVVHIPQGLEKLRKAIVAVQAEIVEAQAERSDIDEGLRLVNEEINTAYAKNTHRQKDANHRLMRLQTEWVHITQDLGIKAELVPGHVDGIARPVPPPANEDGQ